MEELRQREPREECPAFLAFVRRKACCACGAPAPSQAAHIRMSCIEIGKRSTGIGEKPHDRWAVPLCADCHLDAPDAQHQVGEPVFWARVGLNPFELAAKLYAQFERRRARSPAQREAVVARAVRIKRAKKKPAGDGRFKRGGHFGPKIKVSSRPIRSAGFRSSTDKSLPKRKWPSRPFNRRKS